MDTSPKCDICGELIDVPAAGGIFGAYLAEYLQRLYGRSHGRVPSRPETETFVAGPHAKMVAALTGAVLRQNEDYYYPGQPIGIADARAAASPQAHVRRTHAILVMVPGEVHTYLVAHRACIPQDLAAYDIPLSRIRTYGAALDWTFHMLEKRYWNPRGWTMTLERLFGRREVPLSDESD